MARHQHQQRVEAGGADRGLRVECGLLLALVRAAGDPDGARARVLRAQRGAPRADVGRQVEVELDVAGDVRALRVGADRAKALRIAFALRGDHDAVRQRFAEQAGEAAIAPHRARRDARARQHQRHATPAALVIERRPELGLEDDRHPRPHPVEEAPHAARQVVGHVAHQHAVAEQLACALRTGRRHGAQHQRHRGIAAAQFLHQARRRLHLADRHRVHPDAAGDRRAGPESEAFAEVLPVAAVAEAAPQHDATDDRRQQVGDQDVDQAHVYGASGGCVGPAPEDRGAGAGAEA
jgi:hypothetical protein